MLCPPRRLPLSHWPMLARRPASRPPTHGPQETIEAARAERVPVASPSLPQRTTPGSPPTPPGSPAAMADKEGECAEAGSGSRRGVAGLCRGLLRGLIRRAGPTPASPIPATPAGRANGALAPPERMRGNASSRGREMATLRPSICLPGPGAQPSFWV